MDDPFSRMQDPAKRAERYRKMADRIERALTHL
jgi:hypothetical protein